MQVPHASWTHERQCPHERAAFDAARLSLCINGASGAELERAACQRHGALPDADLVRLGALLQASGDVHRIAGHERAARTRRADDDLARVDADPKRELFAEQLRRRRFSASAECSARSEWSSSAVGTPKTASTASPANFSTVPPAMSISPDTAS